MSEKISIAAPACNERENLESLLASRQGMSEAFGEDYEILFVDDGSTDRSGDYLEEGVVVD